MLLELVLEMWTFNVTGKSFFFLFPLIPSLSNTGIDFMNNFQFIKYYPETVLLPNFCFFQNFNFCGKRRALNIS